MHELGIIWWKWIQTQFIIFDNDLILDVNVTCQW